MCDTPVHGMSLLARSHSVEQLMVVYDNIFTLCMYILPFVRKKLAWSLGCSDLAA